MILTDLRIGWRKLASDWGYTCIVVGGLAVAFSSVVLFIAYVGGILYADGDVPDPDRVVRVERKIHTPGADHDWITDAPMAFYDHWKDAGVPIVAATRFYVREMSVRAQSRLSLERVGFTGPDIVKVFGLKALAGDIAAALQRPDGVVVTVSTAQRLFGADAPLGRSLQISGKSFTVLALMPDRAPRSVIGTGILANIKSPIMPEPFRLTSWVSIYGQNYVRLRAGIAPEVAGIKADAYFMQTPYARELPPAYGKIASFRAIALPDLSLHGAGSAPTRRLVLALGLASIIIIVLAAINYVNLTVVRTIARQKEIGVRKAVGAAPVRIAAQFVSEAVVVSLTAFVIGIVIAAAAAPMISEWLLQPLTLRLFAPATLLLTFAASIALGLIAGIYPAWIAYHVNCAQSLAGRGNVETGTGTGIRRVLTVLQFGAAMVLVSTTLVVLLQTAHAAHTNPGYDAASVLAIDAPVDMRDKRLLALRDVLSHLPGVEAIGLAWDVPGRFERNTTVDLATTEGKTVLLAYNYVGPGFFQSYGVTPIAGRLFDPESDRQGSKDIMINARAAKLLGFAASERAIGAKLRNGDDVMEVIGVIPDIRQRSLHDASGGVVYGILQPFEVSVLSVRSRDPAQTLRMLPSTWAAYFTDEVMRVAPVDVQLAQLYDGDARPGKVVGAGGVIALCLAACGLYVLSAYTVRRRSLEIVIRKLYGAAPRDIAMLLVRDLLLPLGLGALVGLPVAVWLGEAYLSTFVDRAPFVLLSLVVAVLAAVAIAVLTAGWHTVQAMRLLPAQALGR